LKEGQHDETRRPGTRLQPVSPSARNCNANLCSTAQLPLSQEEEEEEEGEEGMNDKYNIKALSSKNLLPLALWRRSAAQCKSAV
jgi:hypothetical protein